MTDDAELEELKAATQRGDRNDEVDTEGPTTFTDEIVDALEAIEQGELGKTIAVRDQPIAALLATLDADGNEDRMQSVGQALEDELGREHSEAFDRSEIVRLALRVGLQAAAEETMVDLNDAVGEHARQNL